MANSETHPASRLQIAGQIAGQSFIAHAYLVGERLKTRNLEIPSRLATAPLVVEAGQGGVAVLFKYGAVVFFVVGAAEQARFLDDLEPLVVEPFPEPQVETMKIRVDAAAQEGPAGDTIVLTDLSIEKLQLVAEVLARSVVLDLYEQRVGQNFDRIEPLATSLAQRGRGGRNRRELLQQIGSILLGEHKMVGRAEISDKPDLLWDRPDLERLYHTLGDEFELQERHRALEQKLSLIARTVQTVASLEHDRHSLRVEWYIVILIVLEILLFVYDLFLHGP